MANPKTASYIWVKTLIMSVSVLGTLGGWVFLATHQMAQLKEKQTQIALESTVVPTEPVPLRRVSLAANVVPAASQAMVQKTSTKPLRQAPTAAPAAVRVRAVTRTRSSR